MHEERLTKLGRYLLDTDFSQEDVKDFNYRNYVFEVSKKHPCGTAACAIGLGPIVFPEDWEYVTLYLNHKAYAKLKDHVGGTTSGGLAFFDIDDVDYTYLFCPDDESFCPLPLDSTAKEVGNHILDFVKRGGMPCD